MPTTVITAAAFDADAATPRAYCLRARGARAAQRERY